MTVVDELVFTEVESKRGSKGSVLDAVRLKLGAKSAFHGAEEVRGEGVVGTIGKKLEGVTIEFGSRSIKGIELGTVVVLGMDKDVVQGE